ncbi:MAG TPA: YdeI/OmpD-associated family protein [Microlunatus sp.]
MVEYEQVEFTSAPQLRAWLAEHHDSVRGIWAVTYKRSAGERHLTYEALVREALCYGWIDGQARGVDESRTSLLLTPRRPGSGWSRPNKIRIAELEAAGLLEPAGIAAIEAAKASGSWTLLDSVEAGIEPPELASALDADPAARRHWDAFPKSARRAALEWVATAKRDETRAKRVAEIVRLSAQNERPR